MSSPPIVYDRDREWALKQCPFWARRGKIEAVDGEIVDDGGWLDAEPKDERLSVPLWDDFVAEEIEKFERYFAHERKPAADWSRLWRFSWWPKANAHRRFPKSAPAGPPHPFFRKGSPEFERALAVGNANERYIWSRVGVAQFMPNDKRLAKVIGQQETRARDHKMAAAGERE